MSAVADFYLECAENDIVPNSDRSIPPHHVRVKSYSYQARSGETMVIHGVSVADAITWHNLPSATLTAREYLADFLTTFCACEVCDDCGKVGRPHFFPVICSPERLCVDCA
jgi:hypothetical protein